MWQQEAGRRKQEEANMTDSGQTALMKENLIGHQWKFKGKLNVKIPSHHASIDLHHLEQIGVDQSVIE